MTNSGRREVLVVCPLLRVNNVLLFFLLPYNENPCSSLALAAARHPGLDAERVRELRPVQTTSQARLVSAGIATARSDNSPVGWVVAFVMARSPARIGRMVVERKAAEGEA